MGVGLVPHTFVGNFLIVNVGGKDRKETGTFYGNNNNIQSFSLKHFAQTCLVKKLHCLLSSVISLAVVATFMACFKEHNSADRNEKWIR